MLQSLDHLHGPLWDSLQYVHFSSVLRISELVWPHKCAPEEGQDPLLPLAVNILSKAAQVTVYLLCHLTFNLMSTRTPAPFLPSKWSSPCTYWCLGLFLPMGRTWHFPLLPVLTSEKISSGCGITPSWSLQHCSAGASHSKKPDSGQHINDL